jgi:hypothetical protein
MGALTRFDLDREQCRVPGCDTPHPHPLAFRSKCHPMNRGVIVQYDARTGLLSLHCATCDAPITRVAVRDE